MAAAVRVRKWPRQSLLDAIVEYLSDGSRLLLLDNCEHLLDAIVDLVGHLTGVDRTCVVTDPSRRLGH